MIFFIFIFSLLFLEAVQTKYHLTSYLYDDFFKYHLDSKLSDFLVEERPPKEKKNTRRQTSVAVFNSTAQYSIIDWKKISFSQVRENFCHFFNELYFSDHIAFWNSFYSVYFRLFLYLMNSFYLIHMYSYEDEINLNVEAWLITFIETIAYTTVYMPYTLRIRSSYFSVCGYGQIRS